MIFRNYCYCSTGQTGHELVDNPSEASASADRGAEKEKRRAIGGGKEICDGGRSVDAPLWQRVGNHTTTLFETSPS
jgi:hypothetical protein